MRKPFVLLATCSLLLTGCSFLDSLSNDSSKEKQDGLTSFEFVTDTKMVLDTSTASSDFYLLTIYVGDTYQVKTNIDDKIDSDYKFKYYDFDDGLLSVSSSGLVTSIDKGVTSVSVDLIRLKDNKKIATNYFVVNIKEKSTEFANISINDSSLEYDEDTRTYSLSLEGGDSYFIATSVRSNVAYNKSFALANDEYSSFMNVDSTGHITTETVDEDKEGKVVIKALSVDNSIIYDTIYLNVHVQKKEDVVTNTLEVTNLATGTKINDDDNIDLYVNDSLTFGVKYNNSNKYEVMSVSNSEVLLLDNETNKITALTVGNSDVTFAYEEESITIHVEVKKNNLLNIYATNEGDDFVIINGDLIFLGRMYATYSSGLELDITKSEHLTYVISSLDATHKSVEFTFTDDGVTKTVTYNVLYLTAQEYAGDSTSYDLTDYFNNANRNDVFVLPKEGEINMLVIPVWFTNSTSFFRENQKSEILTDLEYVFNTERSEDGFHSVKQFYEEESNGKFILNCTISDFYKSNTSSKIYGDTVADDITRTHTLADSAIGWYFANHTDESISDYDSNGDGLVDAVSLVYAANYYGTIGDSNGTTAFQFKNNEGNTHKYNNGSFSPIGGIYGFSKSSDPNKQLNAIDLSSYYPGYFFESGSRTIIHETGHMFGLVDLYEDNHATTKYFPAGRFSMQSSDYGGHDPYQMNLVGWSKPQIFSASDYEVGEKITLRMDDFATSGNNILLINEMNEYNSLFDEYMLLELLAPTGLNKYDAKNSPFKFNDAGIRLWHVNSILKNLSAGGKETSEISNSNWVNLKYSNNDQSSEYDLAHWIRNNEEEPYDTVSTVQNSYGLFKAGDSFAMSKYQSQFVNADKLDNKEKLGWEFSIDNIYQTVDGTFVAIITLTRVDNTRTDFDFSARINKDIATQPTGDGGDYATELFGNNDLFSLIYNFNNATAPGYYTQGKPISYKGVCLFASPDGNGGSLVISIKDKSGYKVLINSISITSTMMTKAPLTAIVDDEIITGTSFTGPFNEYDEYNEKGLTFEVNNKSITIQNQYKDGTDYWSVLAIYSISISYHIEKI